MSNEEIARRSRWMMRAMEWDDARARYPNIWHEGMPRHIIAFDRVVGRLRLGDLVAVFYPASQRHTDRAEKFTGLSRVVGLRQAEQRGFGWIDLETAWRFTPPLSLGQQPRRVFLCCDPDWPGPEVALFRQAVRCRGGRGWKPREEELEPVGAIEQRVAPVGPERLPRPAPGPDGETIEETEPAAEESAGPVEEIPTEPKSGPAVETETEAETRIESETEAETETVGGGRMFAGADYSGDMRDPRRGTWLAVVELCGDRLRVARLEATGRHGLQTYLRDPDRTLMNVEAIGLDFPFGLPLPFAEKILGAPFPDEGWWALAKKLEKLSRPDYLVAVQEFRDVEGELKRLTDERSDAVSPLHRVNPDLGPITYHGIRMIAEDRSRFAVRPFESAQARLLLEVYPGGLVKRMDLPEAAGGKGARNPAILQALTTLPSLPITMDEPKTRDCLASRDALDAVIAARCAAWAVLSGEADLGAAELAPDEGERVRLEGWIYGLREPA